MHRGQTIRLLAPVFGPLGVLALVLLVCAGPSDAAAGVQDEWLSLTGHDVPQALPISVPPDLESALRAEYGGYQSLLSSEQLLAQLQSAQVVCIGEAHYEARDMQTAFELVRLLSQKRPVALAVERLSHTVQTELDSLLALAGDARLALLKSPLQSDDYQKVWGSRPYDRSGYPTNTPSQPVFESMLDWAVRNQIPLIALDVTWTERSNGLGEDTAYRMSLWSTALRRFLAKSRSGSEQIVLVAGISHCTNSPGSLTGTLKSDASFRNVVSIGQRDAMYQYLSSAKVAQLARIHGHADLIIKRPQLAVVSVKGIAEFPAPPDYWIAVHTPDTWN